MNSHPPIARRVRLKLARRRRAREFEEREMKRRQTAWGVAAVAAAALLGAFVLRRGDHAQPSAIAAGPQTLPAAFFRALEQAQDRVRSSADQPGALRRLARLYHVNRFYREAQSCYEKLAAISPGLTARDHYYRADLARNLGEAGAAETELRAVTTSEPGYLPAQLAFAEVYFKSGKEPEAAKQYAGILGVEPNQPQATVALARLELQRGDEAAAAARLEELMAAHPESTEGAALLAALLERQGESDRAIALTELSQRRPEPPPPDPWLTELQTDLYDVQVLGLLAEDCLRMGQTNEAEALLLRIEQLDPVSATPALLRGWAAAQAHNPAEAVLHYRRALQLSGDPEKICPPLTQSLLAAGRVAEAADLLAPYYAQKPDSAPIATAYADVVVRQPDQKLARAVLERLLRQQPYLKPQNMSLAKILWTSGEREAAMPCLQRVAAMDAADVASRALMGEYFLGKSDPLAAIPPLEQAIAHVGENSAAKQQLSAMLGAACVQVGDSLAQQSKFADAVRYYERAVAPGPASLNGHAGLANAFAHLREFRRAAEALEKLAQLQPGNPTIYLSWGDVLYQDGQREKAARCWEEARRFVAAGDDELRAAIEQRISGRITADMFE